MLEKGLLGLLMSVLKGPKLQTFLYSNSRYLLAAYPKNPVHIQRAIA